MIGASFDSTKTPLQEILARADKGSLQFPDFQRGWVIAFYRTRSRALQAMISTQRAEPPISESGPPDEHSERRPVGLAV